MGRNRQQGHPNRNAAALPCETSCWIDISRLYVRGADCTVPLTKPFLIEVEDTYKTRACVRQSIQQWSATSTATAKKPR